MTCTLGCSESPENEASSAHDLSSVVNGIQLYEQTPPVARLGQALESVRGQDDRWTTATLLDTACVTGTVRSTLDQMREMGSSSLGMTVTTVTGLALDGAGVGLTTVPSSPSAFVTNLEEERPYVAPTFHFEDIARFQSELAPSSTRVAGIAETRVEHNAFDFRDPRRSESGDSCGSHFVRGITAMRFLAYGFRVDFATESDTQAFHDAWPMGINEIFTGKPELERFLTERGAKVSVHVLVSSGLSSYLKSKLADARCDASNLAGCRATHERLVGVLGELPSLPGGDDTLESVLAPNASWGAYGIRVADYDSVL